MSVPALVQASNNANETGTSLELRLDGSARDNARGLLIGLGSPPARAGAPATTRTNPPNSAPVRVLVVEDDAAAASLLRDVLAARGYEIAVASSGAEAEAMVAESHPDLVLLDIVLPDVDGLVVCWRLRQQWHGPIILVSGTRRRWDRTLGLVLGADDFVSKPFDVEELAARVEAVLRRGQRGSLTECEQRLGGLVIDRPRLHAKIGGQPLPLTPIEFRLLAALATDPNRGLSRSELAHLAWPSGDAPPSRVMDVHVRHLRQKLHALGDIAPRVVTVRGFGYRLVHGKSPS